MERGAGSSRLLTFLVVLVTLDPSPSRVSLDPPCWFPQQKSCQDPDWTALNLEVGLGHLCDGGSPPSLCLLRAPLTSFLGAVHFPGSRSWVSFARFLWCCCEGSFLVSVFRVSLLVCGNMADSCVTDLAFCDSLNSLVSPTSFVWFFVILCVDSHVVCE